MECVASCRVSTKTWGRPSVSASDATDAANRVFCSPSTRPFTRLARPRPSPRTVQGAHESHGERPQPQSAPLPMPRPPSARLSASALPNEGHAQRHAHHVVIRARRQAPAPVRCVPQCHHAVVRAHEHGCRRGGAVCACARARALARRTRRPARTRPRARRWRRSPVGRGRGAAMCAHGPRPAVDAPARPHTSRRAPAPVAWACACVTKTRTSAVVLCYLRYRL